MVASLASLAEGPSLETYLCYFTHHSGRFYYSATRLIEHKILSPGEFFGWCVKWFTQRRCQPRQNCLHEICLLRQYLAQYISKLNPEFENECYTHTEFATNWRHTIANTYGSTMNILAAKDSSLFGLADISAKLTPTADTLSIYLASCLSSSPPHMVTSERNRQCTTHELCRTNSRYMELLNLHLSAPLLSRCVAFVSSDCPYHGWSSGTNNARFQMSPSLHATDETYIRIWLAFQGLERIPKENSFSESPTEVTKKRKKKKKGFAELKIAWALHSKEHC